MVALSSLDLFRKIPKDLSQATAHGGVLTLLVSTVLAAVLLLEVWTYAAGETQTKVVLDRNMDEKLRLNFAVTFLELPCEFAEVEVLDYFGNTKMDLFGHIDKTVVVGGKGETVLKKHQRVDVPHEVSDGSHEILHSDFVANLKSDSVGNELRDSPYTFVLFYVDWCNFCKLVSPIWHELGKTVQEAGLSNQVRIARVDCVVETQFCTDSKIPGYPTIMMFKGANPLQDNYNGGRNVVSFMDYIKKTVDVQASTGKAPALKTQWHQGCLLKGHLEVNRVPGNFHISAKSNGHNFDEKSTNTSHIVHELSFGTKLSPSLLKKVPADVQKNINPLEGRSFVNTIGPMSHEHNIKVISTHYEVGTLLGSSEILGYQMSVSNHQFNADPAVPTARWSYDLSPTAVVISQGGRRWYEFITSLCAIIGGTFTSFQLLNGFLGSVVKSKRSSSKLSQL